MTLFLKLVSIFINGLEYSFIQNKILWKSNNMHPLLKYCILHTSVDNKQKGVRNKQQMHLLLEPGMGYKNLVYWSPRRAELGRCHVIRFQTHRHKPRPKCTIISYWKVTKIYALPTVCWDDDPFSVIKKWFCDSLHRLYNFILSFNVAIENINFVQTN